MSSGMGSWVSSEMASGMGSGMSNGEGSGMGRLGMGRCGVCMREMQGRGLSPNATLGNLVPKTQGQ